MGGMADRQEDDQRDWDVRKAGMAALEALEAREKYAAKPAPEESEFEFRKRVGDIEGAYIVQAREQQKKLSGLLDNLVHSLLDYDVAYEDVIVDWPKATLSGKPEGMTEERLKVAVRNRMRERGQEFPEVARWRLRAAIGFRSEEE